MSRCKSCGELSGARFCSYGCAMAHNDAATKEAKMLRTRLADAENKLREQAEQIGGLRIEADKWKGAFHDAHMGTNTGADHVAMVEAEREGRGL